ncbi:hypothetical protein COCCADRAFT_90129 [Bipolaris zeicola 26-R-13]|uniref:Uncharacterized protein n=1 Tax=Cochliobolus carbonum (strain 26-R-13) TaxID=930089 RepID=W6YDJ7_COCC2|nr:uncharacterized protein COCCADRAFT_90129 [Bipolaris zeicola 26-R-13]EUC35690.1 hypothetical protein COCCADRAFT_90129 [Bipolaris zeicola 26-R-13]
MLLVGDTECGKACLARAWTSSQHSTPGSVTSAIPNTGKTVVNIRGCGIGLDVWDIGTAEDLSKTERQEILRRDFDGNTHVLLICVDINKPNDFVDTACTCNAKARDYFPDVPRVLVGCNNDLRLGTSERKNLKSQHIPPFASSWGHKLAASIHALAYFEVSKSDNQGSSDLFDFVGAYMLRYTVK